MVTFLVWLGYTMEVLEYQDDQSGSMLKIVRPKENLILDTYYRITSAINEYNLERQAEQSDQQKLARAQSAREEKRSILQQNGLNEELIKEYLKRDVQPIVTANPDSQPTAPIELDVSITTRIQSFYARCNMAARSEGKVVKSSTQDISQRVFRRILDLLPQEEGANLDKFLRRQTIPKWQLDLLNKIQEENKLLMPTLSQLDDIPLVLTNSEADIKAEYPIITQLSRLKLDFWVNMLAVCIRTSVLPNTEQRRMVFKASIKRILIHYCTQAGTMLDCPQS